MLTRQRTHTTRDRRALSRAVANDAPQEIIDVLAARVAKRRTANMRHAHRSVNGNARAVLRDFPQRPLEVSVNQYGIVQ